MVVLSKFVMYCKDRTLRRKNTGPYPDGYELQILRKSAKICKQILCHFSLRIWPHRLTVRTSGSHPDNRSSILRAVTKLIPSAFRLGVLAWMVFQGKPERRRSAMTSPRPQRSGRLDLTYAIFSMEAKLQLKRTQQTCLAFLITATCCLHITPLSHLLQ